MKYQLINPIDDQLSVVEQIFLNRGVEIDKIADFVKPGSHVVNDPLLLNNIEVGAHMLLNHLNTNSKIYLQVDSDCDGYTSSALLLNYLYKVNPEYLNQIDFKLHPGKEHGLSQSFVDNVTIEDYELVVVPDAGSNQIDLHGKLGGKGIDVLVLDHHEAHYPSESAIIVNPQLDDYPNKELSGVGIVYKFCKVLDSILEVSYADEFLDLVALGMIADMVDMRALETRYLTIKGLESIRNLFIKALVEKQSYSMRGEVTPTSIGFYIAPLINGTIRAGTDEEKEVVFKSLLDKYQTEKIQSTKRGAKSGDMEMLMEYGSRIVTNVKARQNRVRDDATKDIESIITFDRLHENKIIPIVVENSVDKNLSGLIANKLMSKYQRPVMILRKTKEGMVEGSARGYEKSDLNDFKTFLNDSGLVEYAEGHANAFGVGLKEENLAQLIDHANTSLEHIDFSPKFMVDYIYEINNLSGKEILSVAGMKDLWGKGFDEAVFCIKGLRLKKDSVTLLSPDRSPTLKLQHKDITFIKFGSSKQEYESLLSEGYVELDLIGKFSMNEWQGEISPQVQIQDYIITKNIKYYF